MIVPRAYFYQMRNHEEISVLIPPVHALINDYYSHVYIIKRQLKEFDTKFKRFLRVLDVA